MVNPGKVAIMIMSIEEYLKRVGFSGTARADLETLTKVQELHVKSVPYENLEVMARKPLTLDIPSLYEKIVTRGRGGYCFELNGLFVWLLDGIGFKTIQHFGRWLRGESLETPMRRHRVIRVPLDGKEYICDVGVGMTAPRWPLVFELDAIQDICGESYRIVRHPVNIYVVEYFSSEGTFKPLYCFNDDPCVPIDYFQAHYYCTTHPDSIFLNDTMVYIRTESGHNTIADAYDPFTGEKVTELRQYENGSLKTTIIQTKKQFDEILRKFFGFDTDT